MPALRFAIPAAVVLLTLIALTVGPSTAAAQDGMCRTMELEITPSDKLQMVVWLEDTSGNYVTTAYITNLTGRMGMGNRPGRMDFNSGLLWPYGRRVSTFPVWAHRHGMSFPAVVFQNEDADNLSHPLGQSSNEEFYCRPIQPTEAMWDAVSCSSTMFTDKGKLSAGLTSLYPPRSDLSRDEARDHETVSQMATMNPFDSVSQATPPGGMLHLARWSIPPDLPNGDYVVFVEVSKEFDQNASYDYPAPEGIPWSSYGAPYRGQPSVLYSAAIAVLDGESVAMASDYIGYGDPDGLDGDIRTPDTTITTDVPGSGAARLLLTSDGADMFRMRVTARAGRDDIAPGAPSESTVVESDSTSATFSFIAPGEDDDVGTVTEYEIRYQAGTPITEANFDGAVQYAGTLTPAEPGTIQSVMLDGLIPQTNYYVAIRGVDDCLNKGPLEVLSITTALAEPGEVDYCFIATAAYGSLLANDVTALRKFRDVTLRGHVGGELAVAGYYTFGPVLARLIEPSETARQAARGALAPLVDLARSVTTGSRH